MLVRFSSEASEALNSIRFGSFKRLEGFLNLPVEPLNLPCGFLKNTPYIIRHSADGFLKFGYPCTS